MDTQPTKGMNRRSLLGTAGIGLAASALAAGSGLTAVGADAAPGSATGTGGRRKLGTLEVSSVGPGVQNMHRTYQTTVPSRPEMIRITAPPTIRASPCSIPPRLTALSRTS